MKALVAALSLALAAGALSACDKSGRKEPRKVEPMPNLNRSPQPEPPKLPDQAPPLEKKGAAEPKSSAK